jgi:hypothetical protein
METKDYNRPLYSQKDVYAIVAKIIVPVVALVLIYARFLNVESTQQSIVKSITELEEKVDENNSAMYRHVSSKEKDMEGRLDRKTARNEKTGIENKSRIDRNSERIIVLETTD